MKVQDLAYRVAMRTIEILEGEQHYKVPDHTRKEVADKILSELDSLIKGSKK